MLIKEAVERQTQKKPDPERPGNWRRERLIARK
jgi:hypothetical protein